MSPALRGSELFGYARNAFPGAHFEQEGLLTLADTGTILLDEVTELPMEVQTELVRSLRERRIRLVGAKNYTPIAVRMITATSLDIGAMVDRGRFRKDLHSLLNVSSLKIPSLRERPEDIGDLSSYFIDRINRQARMSRSLPSDIVGFLERYMWPGNVRELENAIEYACFHSSNDLLQIRDFPPQIQISPYAADRLAPVSSQNNLATSDSLVGKSIADIEREAILKTLVYTNGNKIEAAKLLCLGKTTLYRKLKEYGVIEDGS